MNPNPRNPEANPDDYDDLPESAEVHEKPSPMSGTTSGSKTPYPGTIDDPERAGERDENTRRGTNRSS